MTERLFFNIGAQPYERRREQPSRDLGSRINSYIVQGASKVELNHHMLGSGSSTYRSTLHLDLCRFIEHSRTDFHVKCVQEAGGSG